MKAYIILTDTIYGLGGSIIYVRNKINYVRTLGYKPFVFYCIKQEKIHVEELLDFQDNIINDLLLPIDIYSLRERKRISEKIFNKLGQIDKDSIIESHTIRSACWGEYFASVFSIKNLVFLLHEKFNISNKGEIDFFKFKYDRKELVGIVDKSLPILFSDFYGNIESRYLPAYCNNVVEDICCPQKYCVKEENVFCIGSIGRIDKAFVFPTMERIVKFTQRYSDHKFVILCIGGSNVDSNKEQLLLKLFEPYDNVRCLITGLIYPIPYSMIIQMDLFISTAGAAHVSNKYGVPTITIDTLNFEAIGILGYTTSSTLYKEDQNAKALEEYIEDVFVGKYKKNIIEYEDFNYDFSLHRKFIEESSKEKDYFSFDVQKKSILSIRKKDFKLYLLKKIGFDTYNKMFNQYTKFKKIINIKF